MNFSYKKLLKTHNHSYFDFVDINPDSDQAFYLDAEQISLCDDKYSRDATKAIDSFSTHSVKLRRIETTIVF